MAPDRDVMYNQSNKMAMEYAKHAIQFAFLLNGAAATALFSKDGKDALFAATLFCTGAILAVFVMAFAYLFQLLMTESWKTDERPLKVNLPWKTIYLSDRDTVWLRLIIMLTWLSSMFCAVAGAVFAN